MEEGPNADDADDAEHLGALSIGHFILSALALLGAVPVIVYGAAGAKLVDELGSDLSMAMGDIPGQPGTSPFGGSPDSMIQDLGTLLTTVIAASVILAVVTAIHLLLVGIQIRRRRWWTFCYLTGWGECLMFPFGTILGVFTILVLSRSSVKRLFGVD